MSDAVRKPPGCTCICPDPAHRKKVTLKHVRAAGYGRGRAMWCQCFCHSLAKLLPPPAAKETP